VRYTIIALFVVSIFSFWFYLKDNSSSKDTLNVGMMSGWAPFMVTNKNGEFEGFDVDVAEELAARLGKKINIIDMGGLASLFVALDQNKIDLIFSGLDITEKRREQMNMVPYTGEDTKEYTLLFYKNIPEGILSIEDLKNHPNPVVLVEPGVSAEKYLDSLKFIQKKQLASLSERILDLQYGKSLAMLVEPSIARRLMLKDQQFKGLSVPLPPLFQIYGMGIALKKENGALFEEIQLIVASMKKDKTLSKLEEKWQLSEVPNEL
jgi:ABC-type amino acid transport substrate-binding protein